MRSTCTDGPMVMIAKEYSRGDTARGLGTTTGCMWLCRQAEHSKRHYLFWGAAFISFAPNVIAKMHCIPHL